MIRQILAGVLRGVVSQRLLPAQGRRPRRGGRGDGQHGAHRRPDPRASKTDEIHGGDRGRRASTRCRASRSTSSSSSSTASSTARSRPRGRRTATTSRSPLEQALRARKAAEAAAAEERAAPTERSSRPSQPRAPMSGGVAPPRRSRRQRCGSCARRRSPRSALAASPAPPRRRRRRAALPSADDAERARLDRVPFDLAVAAAVAEQRSYDELLDALAGGRRRVRRPLAGARARSTRSSRTSGATWARARPARSAGCSSCPPRGCAGASTPTATGSPIPGTPRTRSSPPRATSRPRAARDDLYRAIFAYNHADWYVDEVLAARPASSGGGGSTRRSAPFSFGSTAIGAVALEVDAAREAPRRGAQAVIAAQAERCRPPSAERQLDAASAARSRAPGIRAAAPPSSPRSRRRSPASASRSGRAREAGAAGRARPSGAARARRSRARSQGQAHAFAVRQRPPAVGSPMPTQAAVRLPGRRRPRASSPSAHDAPRLSRRPTSPRRRARPLYALADAIVVAASPEPRPLRHRLHDPDRRRARPDVYCHLSYLEPARHAGTRARGRRVRRARRLDRPRDRAAPPPPVRACGLVPAGQPVVPGLRRRRVQLAGRTATPAAAPTATFGPPEPDGPSSPSRRTSRTQGMGLAPAALLGPMRRPRLRPYSRYARALRPCLEPQRTSATRPIPRMLRAVTRSGLDSRAGCRWGGMAARLSALAPDRGPDRDLAARCVATITFAAAGHESTDADPVDRPRRPGPGDPGRPGRAPAGLRLRQGDPPGRRVRLARRGLRRGLRGQHRLVPEPRPRHEGDRQRRADRRAPPREERELPAERPAREQLAPYGDAVIRRRRRPKSRPPRPEAGNRRHAAAGEEPDEQHARRTRSRRSPSGRPSRSASPTSSFPALRPSRSTRCRCPHARAYPPEARSPAQAADPARSSTSGSTSTPGSSPAPRSAGATAPRPSGPSSASTGPPGALRLRREERGRRHGSSRRRREQQRQ